jgi:hypothetical protein
MYSQSLFYIVTDNLELHPIALRFFEKLSEKLTQLRMTNLDHIYLEEAGYNPYMYEKWTGVNSKLECWALGVQGLHQSTSNQLSTTVSVAGNNDSP